MRLTKTRETNRGGPFAAIRQVRAAPALAASVASLLAIFTLDRFTGSAPVQHLFYLPIIFAGIRFGTRGGAAAAAAAIALFHLANAAMLPLMGSVLTTRSGAWATVLIAACIVVPQGVVALISPWVGRQAEIWGRRVFLMTAFTALALRGVLFATVADPAVLVVVQLLDGITAASLGVMVPLMIADISRGTGHFSFAQGIVGTAVGIGASISPTLAGYLSDQFGSHVAFFGLAGIATVGLAAVATILPETRPAEATSAKTP